jgi:hypothetical protein
MLLEAALATDCITLFFSLVQHFAKLCLSLRVGCYLLRADDSSARYSHFWADALLGTRCHRAATSAFRGAAGRRHSIPGERKLKHLDPTEPY